MEAGLKLSSRRLQKNIELWSRWDPRNAVTLQYLDTDDYEICETAKGEPNLRKGEFFFHDSKGALDEARRWFESIDKSELSLLYIYGVGLGYPYLAAKEWLQADKKRRIVFFEDDMGALAYLFQTSAGSEMLRSNQVRISFFHDVLRDHVPFKILFWKFVDTPFSVEAMPSYRREKGVVYDDLAHRLVHEAQKNNMVVDEYKHCGNRFYRNFYHNLLHLPDCYEGNKLNERFPKVPAIICGAGPSLGKQLDLLSTLSTRALIFAGGSALNALNGADIMPHFGGGIDPNEPQYDRYLANTSYEIPFFFKGRLYHKAFDLVHGRKLYMTGSGGYKVTTYFEEMLGIDGDDAFDGFNVINFLISVARNMGCDPIILVGMDLGYTGEKVYAPGVVEDAGYTEEMREDPQNYEYPLLKKDIYGKPLYTLWKWISESEWIEKFAEDNPEVTLLNATEGGLGCGKVPNVTLQEAVDTYCTKQNDYYLWVHSEVEDVPLNVSRETIVKGMKHLAASLKQSKRLLDTLIKDTKTLRRQMRSDKSLSFGNQGNEAALAEMELSNEDGFLAILSNFNEMYNVLLQGQLDEIRYKGSERRLFLKKMQMQEEKYRFLKKVAQVNILFIEDALRKEKR